MRLNFIIFDHIAEIVTYAYVHIIYSISYRYIRTNLNKHIKIFIFKFKMTYILYYSLSSLFGFTFIFMKLGMTVMSDSSLCNESCWN